MANPPNSDKGFPSAANARPPTEHQDTVLLSDVREAASLMPEASVQPPALITVAQLNSLALAPLSQRYNILGEAGHGSMGNVYKARDHETGETVALKLLKPEIASDQVMMERFKNELLFARKITHKNVCRVYEFNRIAGIAYTSMEFVEGESLRSVLNRFGGLPPRKAFDLVLQICSGLAEAHAQGIVQRDLKPENVMIDAQGNVKIMDFGIARSMETMTRLTGSMVGTPAYMAPEQVSGNPVDYRTDIYALGLIMYEVFTGTPAFQAENTVAVALKQMNEAPVPPHEIDPTVPVAAERAILKCLEKEPAKRFQSIAEVEKGLRAPGGPSLGSDLANITFNPSSHAATFSQAPRGLSAPAPKRTSPIIWVLLGAGLVLAAMGGLRAEQLEKFAVTLPPPASFPAPGPPDFALEIPSAETSAAQLLATNPEAATRPDEKPAEPKPAAKPKSSARTANEHSPEDVAAPGESAGESAPAKTRPERAALGFAAPDPRQRFARAFGEGQPAAPTSANGNASYVWVARYEVKDRAQETAKKIEDLGLPTVVIPRHTEKGSFFVVLTGPFGAKRMPSVLQWLQTQGFPNARPVGGQTATRNQNQNPNP